MKIVVEKKSLLEMKVDAIVNPANSSGQMGGGVAGLIKKLGGAQIEKDAMAQAPIAIGEAVLTKAGSLPVKWVIHAPTMEKPAEKTSAEKVFRAAAAAIELAKKKGIKTLAIPGMGTGVGKVPAKDAARAIVDAIRNFSDNKVDTVYLVDLNDQMVSAFKEVVAA
jgi:O-acetyl-ADP-ribose deacetylase (regulator of RNase III)